MHAVRRAVQASVGKGLSVKVAGTGHSFSGIAVAPGTLLDLTDLAGLIGVDRDRARARFAAGTALHRIPKMLARHGLAMTVLGDSDRLSLAGAIATGTHGTGQRFGGLATQVVAATLVTADGEVLTVDEDNEPALLPAVALGLGALGVLVDVTLQCVPAFAVRSVERSEPLHGVLDALDARIDGADHFGFSWFPHTDLALTTTSARLPHPAQTQSLPPATRWIRDLGLTGAAPAALGAVGRMLPPLVPRINGLRARRWGDRDFSDASHRVFPRPHRVRFQEVEYAVPRERLAAAFAGIRALIAERGWRIESPVEVRTAAADDLWLSPATGRDTGYLAVTRHWRAAAGEYFEAVEQIMLDHGGRPHWGTMHTLDAARLRDRYPRFDDFVAVRDRLDPRRVFANPYLDRVLDG